MDDHLDQLGREPYLGTMESLNIAEAKKRLSELVGRVAHGGEEILLTRRGKPMARLVPVREDEPHSRLAELEGWLEEDDEFFDLMDEIVRSRATDSPRLPE